MSRTFSVRAETVQNRFNRLARCCLAIHSELLPALPLRENISLINETKKEYGDFVLKLNILASNKSSVKPNVK